MMPHALDVVTSGSIQNRALVSPPGMGDEHAGDIRARHLDWLSDLAWARYHSLPVFEADESLSNNTCWLIEI